MSEIKVTGFETMSPEMEFADNYNNWILSIFEPYIRGNILEIGTGQGNFKKYIASKISNYVSVDIDEDVIKRDSYGMAVSKLMNGITKPFFGQSLITAIEKR